MDAEIDPDPKVQALFQALKDQRESLRDLLGEVSDHWRYEDSVYRLYHQSFKVYGVQAITLKIVGALAQLAPERPLNAWFQQIVNEGTGKRFAPEHNQRWLEETRPMIEAFFHARFFLEMAVKYGEALEFPPRMMPSGWAALLYLYDLR